ncbi:MAG: hypothetical protein IKX71_06030 [Bacteroidales bacterium]|nr:hypothetical protein [Bacteroidales bacterium]
MKKILTIAATLLVCGSLYAQIDPTVEVSRQYKVNITDIDRPMADDHSVADSLQRFDVDFDYSIFNRPYTDLYEFTPYQTDSISKVTRRRPPYVMAQIGSQIPFSADMMLRSQLVAKPKLNIGVDADLKGTATNLDYLGEDKALGVVRVNGGLSTNLRTAWKKGELTAVVGYNTSLFNDEYKDNPLSHYVNSLGVGVNLVSADPQDNSVFYNVDFNFVTAAKKLSGLAPLDSTYNNSKMSIKGTLGSSFGLHRVYVNMIYQMANSGKGEDKLNVGLLEFMPVYEYVQGPFKMRVGARFGNTYIGADANTTIHPEADLKLEVLKNTIWLRGVVSGGNELNSLVDYMHDAPWLCNGLKGHVSTAEDVLGVRNIETKISIETIIAGRFALSPYIAYNSYSNRLQLRTDFVSTELPILLPMYSDYAMTQIGLESSWKSKNLTITGNLKHNNSFTKTEEPVYMVADWMADASLEYNLKRRFFINAAYTYQSVRKSWGGDIPPYSDLTVVLTGVINRHFSVYVKGGNLLNNVNFRYFAIPELPLNIGGGLRINF